MIDTNTIFIANIYCFGSQKKTFCYKVDDTTDLLGSLVEVEFGKKILFGIILTVEKKEICKNAISLGHKTIDVNKIKTINKIVRYNLLNEKFLQFLQKMSWYNIVSVERLLENVVPVYWINKKRNLKSLDKVSKKRTNKLLCKLIQLNAEQNNISNKIKTNGFFVSLIRGSMGSGKTYIFLEVVRKKIIENANNQILIMVPEIALTTNLINIIYQFTGIEPIIWHSSVPVAKKKVYYENIINGTIKIVISTRSGLLLPYKQLSLIVIDEEHDRSYKQDETPCYHARDMAILRAKYENIPVILSSATPSVETLKNVVEKKYEVFSITKQYFETNPPDIEFIDNNFHNKNTNC